jgi:signal transduction histidine kinase
MAHCRGRLRLATMRLFGHLRTRLIVPVLFAVIPLAGLMLHTASEERRIAVAGIKKHLLTLVESAAREEELLFDSIRQVLIGLALHVKDQREEPLACSAYLTELLKQFHRYKNFGVAAIDGKILASAVPEFDTHDVGNQEWFQNALAKRAFAVGKYSAATTTLPSEMIFACPLIGTDGQTSGVVFAELDVQFLYRFQSAIEKELPEGSTITQVSDQGVVLTRYPEPDKWLGRSVAETPLFKVLSSQKEGFVTMEGLDGLKRFYAFFPQHSSLRDQNVYLLLGISKSSLFSQANRLLIHNLLLLGLVTLLILLAAWFGGDLLVLRQVGAMLKATRRLANGDLGARTGLPRKAGELNELAASFDNMAASLELREAQRQQGEEALRRSQEELRNLSAHLESVREEERTRLAREIHDELGQTMTALKMDLSWLNRRLEQQHEALHAKTHSMETLIDATIRTVQRLSSELRPGLLDDLGLAAAIEWQAEEFQKRAGIACDVRLDLGEITLSRDHTTAIFRIYQETLTNVIRHARATRVSVLLQAQDNQMVLEVKDNGRGITEEETRGAKAFGLIGMRERVIALKGQLVINGRPGQGTTVTVTVPLINRENAL